MISDIGAMRPACDCDVCSQSAAMSVSGPWGGLLGDLGLSSDDEGAGANHLPHGASAAWAGLLDDLADDIRSVGDEVDMSSAVGLHAPGSQSKEECAAPRVVNIRSFFRPALSLLGPGGVKQDGAVSDSGSDADAHAARPTGNSLQVVPFAGDSACDALFPSGPGYLFVDEVSRLLVVARKCPEQLAALCDPTSVEVNRYWLCSKLHTSSMAMTAQQLGVSEHTAARQKHLCAAGVIAFERQAILRILGDVVSQVPERSGRLISFWWLARYDETPLRFRMCDSVSERVMDIGAKAAHLPSSVGFPSQWKDSVPHKILQSQVSVAMLLYVDGKYIHLWFPMVSWLQAMDSTSDSCYWRAVRQVNLPCDDIARRFERQQRLAVTDGDGAVAKSERGNLYMYPDRSLLHIDCQVHNLAGTRKYTMLLVGDAVAF